MSSYHQAKLAAKATELTNAAVTRLELEADFFKTSGPTEKGKSTTDEIQNALQQKKITFAQVYDLNAAEVQQPAEPANVDAYFNALAKMRNGSSREKLFKVLFLEENIDLLRTKGFVPEVSLAKNGQQLPVRFFSFKPDGKGDNYTLVDFNNMLPLLAKEFMPDSWCKSYNDSWERMKEEVKSVKERIKKAHPIASDTEVNFEDYEEFPGLGVQLTDETLKLVKSQFYFQRPKPTPQKTRRRSDVDESSTNKKRRIATNDTTYDTDQISYRNTDDVKRQAHIMVSKVTANIERIESEIRKEEERKCHCRMRRDFAAAALFHIFGKVK